MLIENQAQALGHVQCLGLCLVPPFIGVSFGLGRGNGLFIGLWDGVGLELENQNRI